MQGDDLDGDVADAVVVLDGEEQEEDEEGESGQVHWNRRQPMVRLKVSIQCRNYTKSLAFTTLL